MPRFALPASVERALAAIRAAGGRPLLVGGFVRDGLLGLPSPEDLDVEVYGLSVERLCRVLSSVGRVHAVGRSFGVMKVRIGEDRELDVSLPRRESKIGRGHRGFLVEPDPALDPRLAASRRDFTVNAMAYDAQTGELLDFFGGRRDLERRCLRHTSEKFAEDPLRVLRGMQLAARFDFVAAPETSALCRRVFTEYDTLAIERIWGEWLKWCERSRRPSAGLRFLLDAGWLDAYPELGALVGCPQDERWHPEGDVWTHTLHVADEAARIAARQPLPRPDRTVLLLTALCHDLGKPGTTVHDGNHVRSPGHAAMTEPVESFLKRIGAPEALRRRVVVLSRSHLEHLHFVDSARHVRRLAHALAGGGETIAMLALLVEADEGGRPPLAGGLPPRMRSMLELARELEADAARPEPILRGRDLIARGLEPGPRLGAILRRAYEAQLDGAFDDREGGLDWLRVELERPSD